MGDVPRQLAWQQLRPLLVDLVVEKAALLTVDSRRQKPSPPGRRCGRWVTVVRTPMETVARPEASMVE